MKKKLFKRFACVASAAVLCVGAAFAFTGCTTKHPKVTITYNFNGEDYAVTYTLSRYDAPQTVQHFIEVAQTGFYDGTVIHDYDTNFLYGGAYELDGTSLVEKDYFTAMKTAEQGGKKFTQSVWANGGAIAEESPVFVSATDEWTPLYTVYGEFDDNGSRTGNARENVHAFGALVMYYTEKVNSDSEAGRSVRVRTVRNDGKTYDIDKYYNYNSATSMFYTFLGQTNVTNDQKYSVFGMVDDNGSKVLSELRDAINDWKAELDEEDSFTESVTMHDYEYMLYEPIDAVRRAGFTATFNVPVDKPITVTSVKINKF